MIKDINACEFRYKKTIGSIGLSLLLFLLVFYLGNVVLDFAFELIANLPLPDVVIILAAELLYAALYAASFMLPVLFLKKRIQNNGYAFYTMYAQPKLSPALPLMIFASLAIVRAASYVNFEVVTVFQGSDYAYGAADGLVRIKGYRIILDFLVSCIIPGFCEEFLFRGAILTNCLPFGRTNAIFISAFLFALMHENIMQMLFAFVAGILLGLIYVRTKSIWNCIILHVLNNMTSLIEDVIYYNFSSFAGTLLPIIEAFICLLGALSIGILLIRFFSRNTSFEKGIYQRGLPATDSYAPCTLQSSYAVKLFFASPMIVFVAITVCSMILDLF